MNTEHSTLAVGLSEQYMADLAVWYSSLPPLKWKEHSDITQAAETLVYASDNKRLST